LKRLAPLLAAITLAALAAACSSGDASTGPDGQVTLRLGYFPNLTHAQPIVGLARGTFADALGSNVTIDAKTFNAGGDEIAALFAGQIDIGYIGPSPAVNGYVKSKGDDVRIIAGAVSGGAALIVRDGAAISTPADLANKKVATPQLGNTQDVALRIWLKDNGLAAKEQGGNVTVIPMQNADTLTAFQTGGVDAAWAPEPWSTRLIQEAGGKLFLDEKDLWPGGQFPTTTVIARADFLKKHPDAVLAFLRGHIETTQWIAANSDKAKALVNDGIKRITSKALKQATIDEAWKHMSVTNDPLAPAVLKSSDNAFRLDFLGTKKPDLSSLFALDLLNEALQEKNLPPVEAG
jgi:sulfonate transport system substrate-binding protein